MTQAAVNNLPTSEQRDLSAVRPLLFKGGLGAGVLGLVGAIAFAAGAKDWTLLGLSYLTALAYFLSISLGALCFVLLQHATRAGWSVTVRRLAELMAANVWILGVLTIPVLVFADQIYLHWAADHGHLPHAKSVWLSKPFFSFRVIVYFLIWIGMSRYFLGGSLEQDDTGDRRITERLERRAPFLVLVFALTLTYGAWDLFMSLDPHWYSTMFGVYYFAGSMIAFFASSILILRFCQARGILTRSVTLEHYHDLGKFLFTFVFFWGYIAYSQYMLIWYGNLPEETAWFDRRGATTHPDQSIGWWKAVSVVLVVGHLLIPFPGLVSRWAKRLLGLLTFWCIWMLVFHFVDLYWVIVPAWKD
ncbi:MAG: quinol:cytochrome C oxidoreductase, partial [Phycisphaerae bacterium]|nr:quinol:cytochrome C oxidoreductase [Phycisphaerae bacterium]